MGLTFRTVIKNKFKLFIKQFLYVFRVFIYIYDYPPIPCEKVPIHVYTHNCLYLWENNHRRTCMIWRIFWAHYTKRRWLVTYIKTVTTCLTPVRWQGKACWIDFFINFFFSCNSLNYLLINMKTNPLTLRLSSIIYQMRLLN